MTIALTEKGERMMATCKGCDCFDPDFGCVCMTKCPRAPKKEYVEVKHGEWITLEAEIGLYSCSLCGHKILRAECNYCPNCGAKMDGGVTDGKV